MANPQGRWIDPGRIAALARAAEEVARHLDVEVELLVAIWSADPEIGSSSPGYPRRALDYLVVELTWWLELRAGSAVFDVVLEELESLRVGHAGPDWADEDHVVCRAAAVWEMAHYALAPALLEAADDLVATFELGISDEDGEELRRRTDLVRQELIKLRDHSPSFLVDEMLRLFSGPS
jgi:hypothetical protein